MAWNFLNGIPIYLQIADNMKLQIAGGAMPPGSRLPSVRDLALQAGVNPNTMQRALSCLEAEGLVRTPSTNGRYVTEDMEKMKELRRKLSEAYIQEFFDNLKSLGMTEEEILETAREWVQRNQKEVQ